MDLPSTEDHPPEHHQIKRTLWQRWMDWSGSFLVVSILVHIILLGGATVLVVQVVQGQKDKLKFTAPPPSPNAGVEHKVKPSKKTAAAAPAISKRITTSAVNASVALPAMDLNSTGPDVMASVMSGMGSSGLGAGAGGAAGMASMPLAGMTAFGFKGMSGVAGLTGYLYDLKQDKDHQPTNIKDDGFFTKPHLFDEWDKKNPPGSDFWWKPRDEIIADKSPYGKRDDLITKSVQNEGKFLADYFNKDWDESMLEHYYRSQEPLTAFQFFIPWTPSGAALKAFGVEKEVKPTHFIIHYKGYLKAPKDGDFRFRVAVKSGCTVAIRYDGKNVYGPAKGLYFDCNVFDFTKTAGFSEAGGFNGVTGRWFNAEAGKKVPMEVFLKNGEGGMDAEVFIEERHPAQPYRKTLIAELYPQAPRVKQGIAYPVFSLRKGVPLPPRTTKEQIAASKPQPEKPDDPKWWMYSLDYADPIIFQGCK